MSSSFFKLFISTFSFILFFIFLIIIPIYLSKSGVYIVATTAAKTETHSQILSGKLEWPAPRIYSYYFSLWL